LWWDGERELRRGTPIDLFPRGTLVIHRCGREFDSQRQKYPAIPHVCCECARRGTAARQTISSLRQKSLPLLEQLLIKLRESSNFSLVQLCAPGRRLQVAARQQIQAAQQGRRACLGPRLRPLIVRAGIRSEGGGRPSPFRGERSRRDDDCGGTGSCGLQLWSGSFLCCSLSPLCYLLISSGWNLMICLLLADHRCAHVLKKSRAKAAGADLLMFFSFLLSKWYFI
jgi:hypothetical protein